MQLKLWDQGRMCTEEANCSDRMGFDIEHRCENL